MFERISYNYNGANVLVTGGSNGIGLACAQAYRSAGAEVIITGRKASANDYDTDLDGMEYRQVNIQDRKALNALAESLGNLDILINNAGITGPTDPLWEYDIDMWNKIVKINLMGTFNCCRSIVPNMIKNNYGRIVNVASVAGKDGNANASAYSSGKAGAIGLTKALGKELADKDIAVNAVTPAGAKTRILDQMSKEHVQRMLSKVPRGRFLEIYEFTSLICWLSSDENTFSTAAVFDISGGRSTY